MTNLLELAERCEKAMGPDRELDAAVNAAIGLPGTKMRANGFTWVSPNVPGYTASLDAALTLVPGDEAFDVARESKGGDWTADLSCFCPDSELWDDVRRIPFGRAVNPALALTAAALRARAHLNTQVEV